MNMKWINEIALPTSYGLDLKNKKDKNKGMLIEVHNINFILFVRSPIPTIIKMNPDKVKIKENICAFKDSSKPIVGKIDLIINPIPYSKNPTPQSR